MKVVHRPEELAHRELVIEGGDPERTGDHRVFGIGAALLAPRGDRPHERFVGADRSDQFPRGIDRDHGGGVYRLDFTREGFLE